MLKNDRNKESILQYFLFRDKKKIDRQEIEKREVKKRAGD